MALCCHPCLCDLGSALNINHCQLGQKTYSRGWSNAVLSPFAWCCRCYFWLRHTGFLAARPRRQETMDTTSIQAYNRIRHNNTDVLPLTSHTRPKPVSPYDCGSAVSYICAQVVSSALSQFRSLAHQTRPTIHASSNISKRSAHKEHIHGATKRDIGQHLTIGSERRSWRFTCQNKCG